MDNIPVISGKSQTSNDEKWVSMICDDHGAFTEHYSSASIICVDKKVKVKWKLWENDFASFKDLF